jgi:hypothetical protein
LTSAGIVGRTDTNTTGPYATAYGDGVYPVANIATTGTGNQIYGVIVGVETQYGNLSQQYLPASTGGRIRVCRPNYETLFIVGEDGLIDPLDLLDVGNMCAIINNGSGSTTTGYSTWVIDSDTNATTTNQVIIRGLYNEPGNVDNVTTVAGDNNTKWLVSIADLQHYPTIGNQGI